MSELIVNGDSVIDNLSEQLRYWRAERPDEWIMDDFIRKALALEKACMSTLVALRHMQHETKGHAHPFNPDGLVCYGLLKQLEQETSK